MANVLPPEAKKRLGSFYRMRFIFVGALVLLFTATLCICAYAPTYIALRVNEAYEVRSSRDIAEAVSFGRLDPLAATKSLG